MREKMDTLEWIGLERSMDTKVGKYPKNKATMMIKNYYYY